MDREQLKNFAQAVRESTTKRLRLVPLGLENWRVSKNALSFAEIAKHILESDEWLFEKLKNESLHSITPEKNSITINDRKEFELLINKLIIFGKKREQLISELKDQDFQRYLFDDRFNGQVTVWWVIVRGNLDHEIHHRGQIASYFRVLEDNLKNNIIGS